MKWLKLLAAGVLSSLASSCETTSSYGYYVERLDEDSVETLFQLYDDALNERDFSTYESLLAPNLAISDTLMGFPNYTSRSDHLKFVKSALATAKDLRVSTMLMDVQITGPSSALVVVQEDVRLHTRHSPSRHVVTIMEVDVGFEDGWIFLARIRRTAEQEFRD